MFSMFNYKIIPNSVITGKKYDEIEEIRVRPLVLKELREIAQTNTEIWTISVVLKYYGDSKVIILKGKNGEDLPLDILHKDDLYALMYFVNMLTNPDYSLSYIAPCPKCGKDVSFKVGIDSISYKQKNLPEKMPFKLESGITGYVRDLLVKDLIAIEEAEEAVKPFGYTIDDLTKAFMIELELSDEIKREIEQLEYFDELKKIIGEKAYVLKILDYFTPNDMIAIAKILETIKPELNPIKVTCDNKECRHQFDVMIDLDIKDILPEDGLELYHRFRNIS